MKLRNRKTGEIRDFNAVIHELNMFDSLAELNEEWEDYEERPYDYWYIEGFGTILHHTKDIRISCSYLEKSYERQKQIGNYFETREQAEKAVKKLKAWKRLKDKGFKPIDWAWHKVDNPYRDDFEEMVIKVYFRTDQYVDDWDDDLDLLFSQESE